MTIKWLICARGDLFIFEFIRNICNFGWEYSWYIGNNWGGWNSFQSLVLKFEFVLNKMMNIGAKFSENSNTNICSIFAYSQIIIGKFVWSLPPLRENSREFGNLLNRFNRITQCRTDIWWTCNFSQNTDYLFNPTTFKSINDSSDLSFNVIATNEYEHIQIAIQHWPQK